MNELPLTASPLKTIGLAHQCPLRISALEHDIGVLNRANDSHVAVDRDFLFEDVDVARFETAKDPVKHLQRRLNAF